MAYRLVTSLQLGITGITDLRAQLLDPAGANSGSAISTGFTADLGDGQYLWDYAAYPDGFYGAAAFYRASAPGVRWIHAINPQEGENLDDKITSRMATFVYTAPDNAGIASIVAGVSALISTIGTAGAGLTALPGMVWANSVRTLSSFGTLLADLAAAVVASVITALGTSPAITIASGIVGSTITITRAVTFSATVTGVSFPATWSKVYFTVKESNSHPDAQAIVQIVRYNGSGNDGLIRLNKGAATAAQGSLTANSTAGTIAINLTDDATAQLYAGNYTYDLKFILSDSTSQIITYGSCSVVLTSTEAIA